MTSKFTGFDKFDATVSNLDTAALLHQNFADEIQSVLADIRDCNS